MDFEAKFQKNRGTKASKNDVFVDCIFQRLLEGFWEALGTFGKVLGGGWRLLAPLGPFFGLLFGACIQNAFQKGSWRLLGSILAPFWKGLRGIWEEFWEGFGRVGRLEFISNDSLCKPMRCSPSSASLHN